MTIDTQLFRARVKTLCYEADAASDLRMRCICVLALGGRTALEGADPGTEADMLLSEGRDRQWALEECARVLANADAAKY